MWNVFVVDCLSPNCSGNGICIAGGQCRCFSGFWGSDCSLSLHFGNATLCVRDCSGHGTFDFPSQSCFCESGWTGADCEIGRYSGSKLIPGACSPPSCHFPNQLKLTCFINMSFTKLNRHLLLTIGHICQCTILYCTVYPLP